MNDKYSRMRIYKKKLDTKLNLFKTPEDGSDTRRKHPFNEDHNESVFSAKKERYQSASLQLAEHHNARVESGLGPLFSLTKLEKRRQPVIKNGEKSNRRVLSTIQ